MNQEIHINNFRCFKDFNFEMSRVNILIGENSSGKSSLLKFLLSIKQTLDDPEISNLILNGQLVDLGNFKESVYFHKDEEKISFGFMFGEDLLTFFKYFFYSETGKTTKFKNVKAASKYKTYVYYSVNKELNNHKKVSTKFTNEYLGEVEIKVLSAKNKNEVEIGDHPVCSVIYNRKSDGQKYTFKDVGYESKGFISSVFSQDLRSEVKEQKLADEIYFEIAYFLINQNLVEMYFNNLIYLNPLNTSPQRFYFKRDAQSSFKKINLDKFANQVSNSSISEDDMIEFGEILSQYGIVDKIELHVSNDFPVSEIRVELKDLISNISDVGYGVALQIPILFEAFLSEHRYGNLLLIEQPEIHLHPRFQARFIDVLLSMGNKNNYIIETHSEHIVRMLQVLVKEKKHGIKSSDIKIFYFTRENDSFQVSEHNILSDGHLDKNFPTGFYDNSYNLTKSLLF